MNELYKRDLGAYSTPPKISQYIARKTIENYVLGEIEERWARRFKSVEHFVQKSKAQLMERVFWDVLKPIKVLDLAVGNGIFLLAAIDTLTTIASRLLDVTRPDLGKSFTTLKQYFGAQCIFGVDVLSQAVEEARNRIKQSISTESLNVTQISMMNNLVNLNIVTGNSLVGFKKPQFDERDDSPHMCKLYTQLREITNKVRTDPINRENWTNLLNIQNDLKKRVDAQFCKITCQQFGTKASANLQPFHWFVHFPDIIFHEGFDIVIGNPPFLDSKRWAYSTAARSSFKVNYGSLYQAGNADMFAYFVEAGIRLLRPGGFFGFIVSDKWLDVGFGVGLKQFLLDVSSLQRVVLIDQGVFPTAAVDSLIIFGKKKWVDRAYKGIPTAFIRVPKAANLPDGDFDNIQPNISHHIVDNSSLLAQERWSTFLRAPRIYYDIISSSTLEPLASIARIRRGITTGANQFFLLKNETINSYDIPMEFVRPIVDSPRSLESLVIKDVSIYVLAIPRGVSLEELPNGVQQYVRDGERNGIHQRRMVQSRKPWYHLPLKEPAPILAAKLMDKTPMFYLNPSGFIANNVFYEVSPEKDLIPFLWFYLNSTVAHLLIEIQGRSYHGGVLELAAFELKQLPCPSSKGLFQISDRLRRLIPASGSLTKENKSELDMVILSLLGLESRFEELKRALISLQDYRLSKKRRD